MRTIVEGVLIDRSAKSLAIIGEGLDGECRIICRGGGEGMRDHIPIFPPYDMGGEREISKMKAMFGEITK